VAEDRLDSITLEWDQRAAVCVVMAAGGYPDSYEKGKVIAGLADAAALPDVMVFHAGTRKSNQNIVTAGGRVLGVTALGTDIADAQRRAYEACGKITWDGAYYRRDIAGKALG
jgi:phosphoribosylamine--glycine ligase